MTVREKQQRAASAQPRTAQVYDFRRPTTLAREHSRVLELAFETFARQWATQLTAKVRVLSQVSCEEVLMHSYDEYAAGLPATTAMVLCSIDSSAAKAVVQFPASAGLSWVARMLGGTGETQMPERVFTQIEQALVRRLMDDALEDLRYSLGALLTNDISIDGIQYNSQFAQAAPTSELMIVASFDVRVGDHRSRATVAIPAAVILPQLGESNPTSPVENARGLIEAQLGTVPIDVVLRLAPAPVLPGTVLGLTIGDVIPLPHSQHRPLDLVVDGHELADAAVGINGSRLACVVVSTKETAR
ncbi:flagellar motor switch protein FliM [Microterricola gilva]|uniref:Flagellar motor switch protein FliM n=1 Tax=Microterricola gilva TaxID=393267 RepID=A0A4Q8ANG9_9MICO|nr:flagellar motor switch protein FliM [Microterricola gilva]RZU65525.1 flagellar motor switch protein FliM [Microterricola gilva]